jgi:hypothetical protein
MTGSLSNIRKNRRHKSHLLEDKKSREAQIVDKFGGAGKEPSVPLRSTDDSVPATARSTATPRATEKPGQRRAAVLEAGSAS